jgi:hypothetical protein
MSKTKTKTKQWKIGEYAIGGIIKAEVIRENPNSLLIQLQALEYNNPTRVVMADWAETDRSKWREGLDNTLNEMTTCYYADKVLDWIDEQVESFVSPNL